MREAFGITVSSCERTENMKDSQQLKNDLLTSLGSLLDGDEMENKLRSLIIRTFKAQFTPEVIRATLHLSESDFANLSK